MGSHINVPLATVFARVHLVFRFFWCEHVCSVAKFMHKTWSFFQSEKKMKWPQRAQSKSQGIQAAPQVCCITGSSLLSWASAWASSCCFSRCHAPLFNRQPRTTIWALFLGLDRSWGCPRVRSKQWIRPSRKRVCTRALSYGSSPRVGGSGGRDGGNMHHLWNNWNTCFHFVKGDKWCFKHRVYRIKCTTDSHEWVVQRPRTPLALLSQTTCIFNCCLFVIPVHAVSVWRGIISNRMKPVFASIHCFLCFHSLFPVWMEVWCSCRFCEL